VKNYSTSLVINEMEIKATLRFHLTPVRMAILKGNNNKQQQTNAGEDVEKEEPLYSAGGSGNKYNQYGMLQVFEFLKNLKTELPYYPVILILGIHVKER
jgi:hypothetical protein